MSIQLERDQEQLETGLDFLARSIVAFKDCLEEAGIKDNDLRDQLVLQFAHQLNYRLFDPPKE